MNKARIPLLLFVRYAVPPKIKIFEDKVSLLKNAINKLLGSNQMKEAVELVNKIKLLYQGKKNVERVEYYEQLVGKIKAGDIKQIK